MTEYDLFPNANAHELQARSLYARIRKLYSNTSVHLCAHAMASTHPRAIEYLEQAPALVAIAAFSWNGRYGFPRGSRFIKLMAGQFGARVERGVTLKEMFRSYAVPYPMRKLTGRAVAPRFVVLLKTLSRMDPSPLAQAIPPPRLQRMWLNQLRDFKGIRLGVPDKVMHWAAVEISKALTAGGYVGDAKDMGDMLFSARGRSLNPAWSWATAGRQMVDWHTELAKQQDTADFVKRHGLGFTDLIDYGHFPDQLRIGDHDFIALRSGEALWLEGAAMRHCVSSYVNLVVKGKSRIYSVRRDGKRVATLELDRQTESTFGISQLKGPCNAPVKKDVLNDARSFAGAVFQITKQY